MPVEAQYNFTAGGWRKFKEPEQNFNLTAQKSSPTDEICQPRYAMIIVANAKIPDPPAMNVLGSGRKLETIPGTSIEVTEKVTLVIQP